MHQVAQYAQSWLGGQLLDRTGSLFDFLKERSIVDSLKEKSIEPGAELALYLFQ